MSDMTLRELFAKVGANAITIGRLEAKVTKLEDALAAKAKAKKKAVK